MKAWLSGKKTIIGAVAFGAIQAVHTAGQITDEVYGYLVALVVAWTGVAIRSAIKKSEGD
jgi:hypothetical protein